MNILYLEEFKEDYELKYLSPGSSIKILYHDPEDHDVLCTPIHLLLTMPLAGNTSGIQIRMIYSFTAK